MNDDVPLITLNDLAMFGVEQDFMTAIASLLIVVGILIAAIVAFAVNLAWHRPSGRLKSTELIGIVVAVGTVLTAYWQWKDARYESSLKEFYDRLDIANRRMERAYDAYVQRTGEKAAGGAGDSVGALLPEDWLPDDHDQRWAAMDQHKGAHPFEMWIFTEIDNVEYMIQKHQLGFVPGNLLVRALNTFRSRCRTSQTFNRIALFWADQEKTGYSEQTIAFVHNPRVCGVPTAIKRL